MQTFKLAFCTSVLKLCVIAATKVLECLSKHKKIIKTNLVQVCGLGKIMRSLKVPHNEILAAQHLSLYVKDLFFSITQR